MVFRDIHLICYKVEIIKYIHLLLLLNNYKCKKINACTYYYNK